MTRLKGWLISFISSFSYLFIFLIFFFIEDTQRREKALALAIIAVMSMIWAFILYHRIRLIEDTCSTRLDSASQGYVELEGKVSLYDGETVRGLHFELPPMVWFSNTIRRSGAGFLLSNNGGLCTIDPSSAEVISPSRNYNDRYFHAIYPGETIYVLGQLETLKKHRTDFEREALISGKLADWKKNNHQFLDYFDINKDGSIDDAELATARDSAIRSVDNEMEYTYQQPATHVISSPADSRPFLISSIHPDTLVTRYNRAIMAHLFIWIFLSILALAMQVN